VAHGPRPGTRSAARAGAASARALLAELATDSDWTVRWEVAGRAAGATLAAMADDVEPEVRERAIGRMGISADEQADPALEPDHV
jgi:hypothetical protein